MEIISFLNRIDSKIQIDGRSEYRVPVKKQKEFLKTFEEPKDNIERSYNQYLCQNYLKRKMITNITGIGSFFLYPILKRKYTRIEGVKDDKVDAVFLADGKSIDVVPASILKKYRQITMEETKRYYLDSLSLDFINKLERRYAGNWLFKLKIMVKIARYNYLIMTYKPNALIVCNEYSFTSSVMSDFCKLKGIELINVMHGEKLFSLQEAFFHFPTCYVWDEYYISLFGKLRAECDHYIVELPESMIIPNEEHDKTIDYTYYLQEESGITLKRILENLQCLVDKGYSVALRPHPRYTKMSELDRVNFEIENNGQISIQDSLKRTRCAISFCSTVLNQAYSNGIDIVIDDMARPVEYKTLLKKEYIMTKVKHKVLSELIEK